MNKSSRMITWFRNEPLPVFMNDTSLVIGGTNLITAFMDSIVIHGCIGELGITVPFVDSKFMVACPAWQELNHADVDLFLVVKGEMDVKAAMDQLSPFPWRSLRISRFRTLHAKVFTFVGGNGMSQALVGSHNLTAAAAKKNYETGVMIRSSGPGETAMTIADLHERSRKILKNSGRRYDTSCWPTYTFN